MKMRFNYFNNALLAVTTCLLLSTTVWAENSIEEQTSVTSAATVNILIEMLGFGGTKKPPPSIASPVKSSLESIAAIGGTKQGPP